MINDKSNLTLSDIVSAMSASLAANGKCATSVTFSFTLAFNNICLPPHTAIPVPPLSSSPIKELVKDEPAKEELVKEKATVITPLLPITTPVESSVNDEADELIKQMKVIPKIIPVSEDVPKEPPSIAPVASETKPVADAIRVLPVATSVPAPASAPISPAIDKDIPVYEQYMTLQEHDNSSLTKEQLAEKACALIKLMTNAELLRVAGDTTDVAIETDMPTEELRKKLLRIWDTSN